MRLSMNQLRAYCELLGNIEVRIRNEGGGESRLSCVPTGQYSPFYNQNLCNHDQLTADGYMHIIGVSKQGLNVM